MANITESKPLYKNWRMALGIGLSIGLGIKATRIVEHILESRFGEWGTALTDWLQSQRLPDWCTRFGPRGVPSHEARPNTPQIAR